MVKQIEKHEEYIKVIKSIENKIHESLSDKKRLLQLAIFSLIHSMRGDLEKYSALVYHNNDNRSSLSSKRSIDNNGNLVDMKMSREVILPPAPYDDYIIEHYKTIVLEEAEELYNVIVDQIVNTLSDITIPQLLQIIYDFAKLLYIIHTKA